MTRTDKGSARGRTALTDSLAPGYRADDPDFRLSGQRLVEQTAAAGVDAVDVDVDEAPELAGLVKQEIRDWKLA